MCTQPIQGTRLLFLAIDISIMEVNQRLIAQQRPCHVHVYTCEHTLLACGWRMRTHLCHIASARRRKYFNKVIFQIYSIGCIASARRRRCVLYMAHSAIYSTMDYIIQENTWSSSGSTSQRMKQATSKVFLGDESKSIYIVTELQMSSFEGLRFS